MKKLLLAFLIAIAIATPARAQIATATSKLGWTQVGQAVSVANQFVYNYYVDGATIATPAAGVTCVAGTPTTDSNCSANFPTLSLGTHTIAMTQQIAGGGSESTKSLTFSFTIVVLVTPTGLKIVESVAGPKNATS